MLRGNTFDLLLTLGIVAAFSTLSCSGNDFEAGAAGAAGGADSGSSGGKAGVGGKAGAGGKSGTGGTGGSSAAGGAGGALGSSGSGGSTTCSTEESCFNDQDDDCDGDVDCADADCVEARCVAKPGNFALGTLVLASESCPPGFSAGDVPLFRGLAGGGECQGCSCTPNPPVCKADIFVYSASAAQCEADTGQTGGTLAATLTTTCSVPLSNLYVFGYRIGPYQVSQSCAAAGSAAPPPASWNEALKFCTAPAAGGCASGMVCVPKLPDADQCALASGSSACAGYANVKTDLYTGFSDTRSCGNCACGASGAQCDNMHVEVGNDYSCDFPDYANQGQRVCVQKYVPQALLSGQPRPPTCTPNAELAGQLKPTAQQTLCCLE